MIRVVFAAVALIVLPFSAIAAVDIEEIETPGGIKAWLVEEHSIPFAAIEVRFLGGTSLDAPGKRGAVNLMTGLLEEGSGDMDSQAYSLAREELASAIRFGSSRDSLSVSLRFLTENRDATVALAKQALVDPTFPDDAIERVRAQVLSSIRASETDPGEIARDAFDRMTWGDHPYGSDDSGTIDSVTALTRDDMVDAWKAAIARDRVYVSAVGDITPDQLATAIDALLGDLPATGAPLPEEATYRLEPGVAAIDFDTPQAVALFGHEGIPRDDPDFYAAYILSEIFGGHGVDSRLTQEVRVKRGLTYGIGAYLVPMDLGAIYIGQVATVAERMPETIDVVRDEWKKIAETGVTQKELDAAKLFLTGSYPLRFDGNATIAQILVGMQMDGLPIDYIATRNDRINAITLEDANRVAKRIYHPDGLAFVVVGPKSATVPAN